MANNEQRIGCKVGKTTLVDPNTFDGQSSLSNVPVPLEDLSISVELTTERKARTILLQNKDKSTGQSSSEVRVSFLEGTEVNGKKVLTTSFTDLTTTFDDGNNSEGLGITAIDIDFNSSYAPLITINFIDVRGTAIFQNENNVAQGRNKFSTFFQLPYPLYRLTIKGYYGMPVSYCLHMTKFTSRFNSQTGNFEITASFIGYTYAMLSDMLLGFLKAIPYTKKGGKIYEDLKALEPNLIGKDGNVLTLNGLINTINDINLRTQKISSDDPNVAKIKKSEEKKASLDLIKNNIYTLGSDLDILDLDEYNFIVLDEKIKNEDKDKAVNKYRSLVTENIKSYNENNDITIEVNNFSSLKIYEGLTLEMLTSNDENQMDELAKIFNINRKDSEEGKIFNNTRQQIWNHINKNQYGFPNNKKFTVYSFLSQNKILNETQDKINKYVEDLEVEVARTLRAEITKAIGFDPTVRNIINVFTVAAEVFLSVLFEVSEEAKKSDVRRIQLEKFKNTVDTTFDYKSNTNQTNLTATNYYPWPDYRETNDKDGLVEEYLGKPFVLDIPSDVDELNFIDDLLDAFIKSKKAEDKSALALEASQENWIGANPIDTRLFGNDKFPYERIEGLDYKDIIRLMMIRLMTFVFSNRDLTSEEIQKIAVAELDAVLKWSVNEKAVQSLSQATVDDFIGSTGKINSETKNVIIGPESGGYYYTYVGGTNEITPTNTQAKHIIPINKGFTGEWNVDDNNSLSTPTGIERREDGYLFLSNYGQTKYNPSDTTKTDDGAYYLKIFTPDQYTSGSKPTPTSTTPSEISFEALKKEWKDFNSAEAGFDIIGGAYGVQEFFNLNWGDDELKGLPFRYMFYGDGVVDSTPTNKTNGLALKRKASINDLKGSITEDMKKNDKSGILDALSRSTITPFDTYFFDKQVEYFRLPSPTASDNSLQQYMNYVDDNEKEGIDFWLTTKYRVHEDYGKTRMLANKLESGSSEVCYPYINFQVAWDHADDAQYLAPVSLFGSRFYNAQTNDYSKALLFLHTFPWNGLINDKDDSGFEFTANDTIFDKPEIYNTFGQRAGFVSAPTLWVAFIGAMLWRADYSTPQFEGEEQIGGGSGTNDPIIFKVGSEHLIPGMGDFSPYPTKLEFLTRGYPFGITDSEWSLFGGKKYRKTQMTFDSRIVGNFRQYKYLGETLLGLPEQAKNEFKKAFFKFVNTDFKNVKSELEVFNGTDAQWKAAYNTVVAAKQTAPDSWTDKWGDKRIPVSIMKSNYKSFDNYIVFAPLHEFNGVYSIDNYDYNFVMEIKDDSTANTLMLNLFKKESIIANTSFKPWGTDGYSQPNESTLDSITDKTKKISIDEDKLNLYIDTVRLKLKEVADGLSESSKKKQAEQDIFGTADDNIIKLQLYRTCKNIYDKWIGGAEDNNIIFQCGGRNRLDYELVKKRTNNTSTVPKLIDSFRFVTRSFQDIGDKMVINPIPVVDILRDNPNTSFYDAVTSLLSSNNFDFIPLPSYINYGDPEMLSKIFKPMPSYEALQEGTVGPSFVCVYVGQKSKHLDEAESEYTNDGFDVQCGKDGNFISPLPSDFALDASSHENEVAVFAVNYSQQNQNIFKDITLDQSEFSETAESLQIVDEISKRGTEANKTIGGQNLYNVYAVRSYKTEVEMMGNAMIQPMMYFQLNNIPMFHGAYMITHVKHSIKPNFMSTNFTGVRIRKVETPILEDKDLFMSLIDSITNSNVASTTDAGTFGTVSPSEVSDGKVIIPNSVSIDALKNKINSSKFESYKNTKFTSYGG